MEGALREENGNGDKEDVAKEVVLLKNVGDRKAG